MEVVLHYTQKEIVYYLACKGYSVETINTWKMEHTEWLDQRVSVDVIIAYLVQPSEHELSKGYYYILTQYGIEHVFNELIRTKLLLL